MAYNQVAPQQPPTQSFQCSHCVLIFKSKLTLLEHLGKVHGLDVDAALRGVGINTASNINSDIYSDSSEDEHKKDSGILASTESTEPKIIVTSNETNRRNNAKKTLQHKQAAGAKVISAPVNFTSETKCVSNSSRDLKTYTKPYANITKYLTKLPVSNVKSPAMQMKSPDQPGLPNMAKETLVLQECHTSANPNNDGVLKLTATSQHDLSHVSYTNQTLLDDPSLPKFEMCDTLKLSFPSKAGKRAPDGSLESCPTRKRKGNLVKTALLESTAIKSEFSKSSSLMLEFSEDEEGSNVLGAGLDGKPHSVNGDPGSLQMYHCKHCDYTNMNIHSMRCHYQKVHPDIRCNSEYIQDPDDYRYSANKRHEESPQVDTCEETSNCSSDGVSLKSAPTSNKEMETKPSQQSLTSKGNMESYQCKNCLFCSRSVVAMLVHYQKSHPEAGVTIDKIKQAAFVASDIKSPVSPENREYLNTDTLINKSPVFHQNNLNSSKKIREKSALSPQKKISLAKAKMSGLKLAQCNDKLSSKIDNSLSPKPPNEWFYCQFCDYSNTSIDGILDHQGQKHRQSVTIDEIATYTAELLKREGQASGNSPSCDSNADKQVGADCKKRKLQHKDDTAADTRLPCSNAYGRAEDCSSFPLKNRAGEINVPPAEVQSKAKISAVKFSPTQRNKKLSTKMNNTISAKPPNEWFFCKHCDYSHITVKGILGHQGAKHGTHATSLDVIRYTAEMLKREDRSEVQASGNSPSCDSNADKHVEADCEMRKLEHKRSAAADAQASGSNAYFMAEKLFYCQRCNFGHPTPQGVLMHQSKKHRGLNTTAAVVFNYTEIVRKSIKQSIQKSQSQTSPFSSHGLPLPLLYEGDEDKLFCPVCNFGQRSLASIIKHQRIRHPGLMIHTNKIVEYSAMVHEQTQKSRLETTTEQAVKHTSLEQSGTEKAQISHPGNSMSVLSPSSKMAGKMPPSFKIAAKIRSFKCHKCIHATPHVYLLRKHLRTIHKTRHTAQDVLRMAFDTGILQEGYHCEWCVFSHKEAVGLHRHCQEIHASRGISLEHITAQLYVGPKASASKNKQPRLKNASDTDNCPKTSPSQASGNVETRTYPCRACSFKGSSPQSITSHYRAVHPWSVKEDGSVISRKALIVNRQAQDAEAHHELGNESLDSCQVPLEHETLPRLSPHQATASKSYKCHLCVAVFNTQRGLDIHYGMKHPKYIQKPDTLQEVKLPASKHGLRVCVYKCPRCTYVNTSPHGVLTHCQMRHPVFIARAEKLQTDEAQLPNMNECVKKKGPNDRLRYGGYMCKICPLIRASLKKLKSHYEQDHNQAVSNMLKPIPKHSTVIKKQLKFKYQSAQSTVLQAAFSKNKTAGTTCPICKYVCNSKSGLSRHLHIHNRKVAEANEDGVYKCSMCSYSSYMQKYLAQHYERKHAKPGFLAYIVPVDAQIDKTSKPALLDHETRHLENTSETCQSNTPATENKSLVRKCRLCPYSTSIHKHLASHYRKTHGHAAFKKHFVPVCKQQQSTKCKDNKVGNLPKVESERSPSVQCKKCKSSFNSSQLLSVHYTRFHRSDIRVDFTVLSGTSGSGSEGYQCGHCNVKIKSTMKLCSHLDHHRELYGEKANAVKMNTPLVSEKPAETKPVKLQRQVELPEFQTVHELARWNVTKVETFILAASPPASPSKTPEREEPEMESAGAKGHTCKQCGRTFMSLTGLRVHEHSHAAMAALEARSTSSSKEIVDKYTSYSSGTFKPFRCGICSYRTAIMGLLRSHLMKKHSAECPDIAECFAETADQDKKTTLREDKDPPLSVDLQESDCSTEPHESGTIKKPFYFEPLAVQRQLNHYRQVAQASGPSALCETKPSEDSLIHCEYCNFSTEHLSSVRRHYFNRHGKKLLRCKDCCFFTGLRKTMELHQETGHSNCPSEPTHQKDLRCPFCLYQTKNKNNMIDHIILHREERMVPIEVRRPKLSRYLQGIVFRCHRCTFTSASDENLRLHIQKHDDIKPYKCRLCYFDCAQLSELEAHLCDKHQVIRNHELVGQVNLNQMGARVGKVSEEEEERSPSQQGTDEDEDMETEIQQEGEVKNMLEPSNVTHENQERQDPNSEEHVKQNEVLHQDQEESLTENDLGKNVPEQNEEPRLNQGQDNEEENAETEVNGTAVALADMENQEDQAEDDMFTADNTDGREMERNIEPNVDDGDRDKMISEEGRVKQERDLDENRAQHELRGSKEDVERNHSTQGQETVQASLTENSNMSEAAQACELHKKSVQDAKVVEQLEDNLLHEILELDEGGSFALSHDLQEARKQLVMRDVERQNHMLAKVIGARDCSTVEGHLLAVPCHKNRGGEDGSDVSFTSCEGKRARGQKSTRELADLYGEMPLLENEYLKEEMQSHGSQTEMHKEEEWSDSLEGSNEQEQVKGDEKIDEENTNQCTIWKHEGVEQTKEADSPFLPNGAFAAMDGDDRGVFLLSNDDKLFACKLCGRNFINDTELERHIMRHGM